MSPWREEELEKLHYWIVTREAVRQAKEEGRPKPWTQDPWLRDFRWCNVRRLDDRVSRELFDRWYPNAPSSPGAAIVHAVLARLINWPAALDEVVGRLEQARAVLKDRSARGEKVFTGAYVIPGVPGQGKVDSVCDLVDRIGAKGDRVWQPTMRATWANLIQFDGMGSFLAGQVVADLAHLPAGRAWPDVHTWAPLGPGSQRGINRLRGLPKEKPVRQIDFEILLPDLIQVLRPRIAAIWHDRRLQAMDIQNCLCEFDKFRRLQNQEGRVRARYAGQAA